MPRLTVDDERHIANALAALHDAIRHQSLGSGRDEVEKWLSSARRSIERIEVTTAPDDTERERREQTNDGQ